MKFLFERRFIPFFAIATVVIANTIANFNSYTLKDMEEDKFQLIKASSEFVKKLNDIILSSKFLEEQKNKFNNEIHCEN